MSLKSGQMLRADLLIAGLGVLPSTDFLLATDVILDNRGYIPVDKVCYFSLLKKSFALPNILSLSLVYEVEYCLVV